MKWGEGRDLTINMRWGERGGGGKSMTALTIAEGGVAGKDRWDERVAGGRQRQPLQEEKLRLCALECSASRDKVSGFATSDRDARSTLAW
jgi:hypothetical protein